MAHSCIITEKQTKQKYQKHRISVNLSETKTQTHAAGKATLQHAGVISAQKEGTPGEFA